MATDLYQLVTDKIIAQLEAGVIPWVKPWTEGGSGAPMNATTGKKYRGINQLLLVPPAAGNSWLTFNQARDCGANVRKGEKAQQIVFFKPWEMKDKNDPDAAGKMIPLLKGYFVFHTSQVDNLPAKFEPVPIAPMPEFERIAAADKILSQAVILHGGDKAFYSPGHDKITLPRAEQFRAIGDYYATALHELTHWTGHEKRCARDFSGRFGSTAYAREELVAEIGAAFMMNSCQIEGEMQHAAYLASWLAVLKEDKRAILSASSAAQKAVDFLIPAEAAELVAA